MQSCLRAGGRDVTNPLSTFHPEIAEPGDRVPGGGCAAATPSAPQLLFTNAAVASALVGAFYAWQRGALDYEEAYLDVLAGRQVPVRRKLQERERNAAAQRRTRSSSSHSTPHSSRPGGPSRRRGRTQFGSIA